MLRPPKIPVCFRGGVDYNTQPQFLLDRVGGRRVFAGNPLYAAEQGPVQPGGDSPRYGPNAAPGPVLAPNRWLVTGYQIEPAGREDVTAYPAMTRSAVVTPSQIQITTPAAGPGTQPAGPPAGGPPAGNPGPCRDASGAATACGYSTQPLPAQPISVNKAIARSGIPFGRT